MKIGNSFKVTLEFNGKTVLASGTYEREGLNEVKIKNISKIDPDNLVLSMSLKQAILKQMKEDKTI